MRWFLPTRSAGRAASVRQRVFPFLERSGRRQRLFKRAILAVTLALMAAMVGLSPAGRYRVRIWADQMRDAVKHRLLGWPIGRDEIEAEWQVRRRRSLDQTHQSLANFYRGTSDEMRALFRVVGMDPEHVLIGNGRADQTFILSPQVFERDDRGRSYRLRPNTRSVWLRQITLRNGPFGLFEVPDTPQIRAAAVAALAIVDERSVQHTNSWGLRGPEPDLSAPIRGIVLGDSFMQGMFNGDEDTPPLRLQRYLQSAWKLPVTIVNTGHIGYSPEQYYYTLREYGERVKPQFIVISVCPNDFGDDFAVLRGEGDWFDEAGYWLGEIRQWCRSHQVQCLLVPIPTHFQVEGMRTDEFYPGRIPIIYQTISSRYCDPLNDFTDEHLRLRRTARKEGRPPLQGMLYNHDISDNHFSPRGAALWAEVVGRRLTLLIDPTAPEGDTAESGTPPAQVSPAGGNG
jgi:lysophospholipase L1-like esterase